MIIEKDKVVSLHYELRTEKNGDIQETTKGGQPLTFIYGNQQMLPKFEENLANLKTGEKFEFMLDPKNGYGEVNPQMIIDIPKTSLSQDGKLDPNIVAVGKVIGMQDAQGNRFNGTVLEIKEDTVNMDFNHTMAGKDLFFSGEIVEVRNETKEEYEHRNHQHDHECTGCGKH